MQRLPAGTQPLSVLALRASYMESRCKAGARVIAVDWLGRLGQAGQARRCGKKTAQLIGGGQKECGAGDNRRG